MKKFLVIPVFLLLISGCVPEPDLRDRSVGYPSPTPQGDATPFVAKEGERSNAENLAIIDGGYGDTVKINRFKSLLEQLDKVFVEDQTQIADMTVNTQELLKKKGISESLQTIMEGMNKLFYKKVDNQEYKDYLVTYINLRDKGESHNEAISDIRAFNRGLGVSN